MSRGCEMASTEAFFLVRRRVALNALTSDAILGGPPAGQEKHGEPSAVSAPFVTGRGTAPPNEIGVAQGCPAGKYFVMMVSIAACPWDEPQGRKSRAD